MILSRDSDTFLIMVNNHSTQSIPPPTVSSALEAPALRCLESAELFNAGHEVAIRHGNEIYRLRRTRQGKLILTK